MGGRVIRAAVLAAGIFACVGSAASAAQTPPEAEPGWAQRALADQYELGSDIGWTNAPWAGTHNSFNSTGQVGFTLSASDANQQIVNTAQLDAGIRSLELDVHKSPPTNEIRVCHGRGADQLHLGCTNEKLLAPTLAEIAMWLDSPAGEDQVLLLYLEDHMADAAGYDAAAAIVTQQLGSRVYTPPAGGCSEVPGDLTRNAIRAAGKQVLIVSDCGPGTGWAGVAFNWDSHVESRPVDYADVPDCGPDYDRATYDSKVVRYYEDSTALTSTVSIIGQATADDGITPPTAAAMVRCGVDLIGLDQVTGPADPRLEAMVWSWQVNRPKARTDGRPRGCAIQQRFIQVAPEFGDEPRTGWFDRICRTQTHQLACRDEAGTWLVTAREHLRAKGEKVCARRGAALSTPSTGYEAQQLAAAMDEAGASRVWLAIRRGDPGWAQ